MATPSLEISGEGTLDLAPSAFDGAWLGGLHPPLKSHDFYTPFGP
jgi:hypothetical protein